MTRPRQTKIIATLGPATDAPEAISALIDAGADIFRLNMSHARHDWARRVAEAARLMGLQHVVVTSINRDDREDGGAPVFAETIRLVHAQGQTIEVLIPDMRGVRSALETVFEARPEVLNHNVETVPRLYRRVRPQADYQRSLDVIQLAKTEYGLRTKSGIMVGLGETQDEVVSLMADFAAHGVDVMTIGQYLQPTRHHLPVEEFVHPDVFAWYKEQGEALVRVRAEGAGSLGAEATVAGGANLRDKRCAFRAGPPVSGLSKKLPGLLGCVFQVRSDRVRRLTEDRARHHRILTQSPFEGARRGVLEHAVVFD